MTTVFSIPASGEARVETLSKVMEHLFRATGKLEGVNNALEAAGMTIQNLARENTGRPHMHDVQIPGITKQLLLGANISLLDHNFIVTVERDNPYAIAALTEAGYNKVSETKLQSRFTQKKGFAEVIGPAAENAASPFQRG